MKEQAKQTGKFTKGSNKILILTDIQYICKENKVSLREQNLEGSIEKQRKLLKELNSLSTIFYLQAQKLTQVNSKKQSPDVIISSFCVCENLGNLGWRGKKRIETSSAFKEEEER